MLKRYCYNLYSSVTVHCILYIELENIIVSGDHEFINELDYKSSYLILFFMS